MINIFEDGDKVLLIDSKSRRYLQKLTVNGQFHTHTGFVEYNDILGKIEGTTVKTSNGSSFLCLRPTISDFVLKMPRGAQVIYPKDLGTILMLADISVGSKVLEAGIGSGALSLALLRSGAKVTGYEIRPDFAVRAKANVEGFVSKQLLENYTVEQRDVYEGISEVDLDSIILDLPEPWKVLSHAEKALKAGGVLVSYLPSICQVSQLHEALSKTKFVLPETLEVLNRTWHVKGAAVRPDHRMVAHTGFLTHTRIIK